MVPTDPGADDAATGRYRFGDIVVDAPAHTVLRAGELQAVEPKAFAVLLALLQRPGELIGRDDLLDRVWGHRHVTPGVLTRAIAQLRNVLDDDSQHPRYIQTQHALGYRFVGELLPEPADAADSAMSIEAAHADVAQPMPLAPDTHFQTGVESDATRMQVQAQPVIASERRWTVQPARARLLRKWGALALLTGVAGVAVWIWSDRPTTLPADASIAILPFSSLSSDRSDDYFAEGLAVEMHDALAGVEGLKVAMQMSPAIAGRRDSDVKALGSRLGVATVLDASVRREGSRMRISARLADTATGYTLWSETYDRQMSDVFETQSEIASEIVKALVGVLPDGGIALTDRLAPTDNITAYDAYLKGMKELRQPANAGDTNVATMFFNQALAADRGFARAQAGLCRSRLLRFEQRQDPDAFEDAQAACMLASKMDPELREVSLALGDLHRVRGNLGEAIGHYMKAQENPVLRPLAYLGMGRVQSAKGRQDLALGYFERALALRPGDAAIHRQIGHQHYLDGNLAKAIEFYRKATGLEPGNADAWSSLGSLYMVDGNTSAAGDAFQRSIKVKPTHGGLNNLGTLKYSSGDYVAAADLFRRAAALEPGDFRLWGNLGEALTGTPGGAKKARAPFLRAARMAERYVQVKPDDADALATLAWYRANLDEAETARDLAVRAEALGTARGEVALRNAETFAFLGDMDSARERLVRARQAGIPENRIAASPVLRRLPAITDEEAGNAR